MKIKHAIANMMNWARWKFSPRCDISFLKEYDYDDVFFNDYVATYDWKSRKLDALIDLAEKDVMILGCGNGDELAVWEKFSPRHVWGLELLDYSEDWKRRGAQVAGRIMRASVMDLPLKDRSIDVLCSDAVLEHVMDLPRCLKEAHRVLRDGGHFYASFGPLYRTWGGPHTDLGEEHGYDHLRDTEEVYHDKIQSLPIEQKMWWNNNLLNKLHFDQYLHDFNAHFTTRYLGLILSWQGIRFQRAYPEQWSILKGIHPEKDLLIKTAIVVLQKKHA